MSKVTNSMIDIVMRYAEKSTMKFRLGCGIFNGKKLVSAGYNIKLQECSIHAEMHALEKLLRSFRLLKRFRNLLETNSLGKQQSCFLRPKVTESLEKEIFNARGSYPRT